MKIKHFFLIGAILMGVTALGWLVGQWILGPLSADDLKLYGIRRELAIVETVVLYIAYKIS